MTNHVLGTVLVRPRRPFSVLYSKRRGGSLNTLREQFIPDFIPKERFDSDIPASSPGLASHRKRCRRYVFYVPTPPQAHTWYPDSVLTL